MHGQKIDKKKQQITFTHKNRRKITLSLLSKPHLEHTKAFHIQVGAFKQEKSLKVVQNLLKDLNYFTFKQRAKVNNISYLKLLIGEYTTYEKSNIVLKNLKRQYPQHKNIQEAFIIELNR